MTRTLQTWILVPLAVGVASCSDESPPAASNTQAAPPAAVAVPAPPSTANPTDHVPIAADAPRPLTPDSSLTPTQDRALVTGELKADNSNVDCIKETFDNLPMSTARADIIDRATRNCLPFEIEAEQLHHQDYGASAPAQDPESEERKLATRVVTEEIEGPAKN